jgi:hypothetical protein
MDMKKILKISGIVAGGLLLLLVAVSLTQTNSEGIRQSMDYDESSPNLSLDFSAGSAAKPPRTASKMMEQTVASDGWAASEPAGAPVPAADKKIIKTGSLSLKVEKVETAAESIANIAKLYQGDIYNSNFSESSRGTKSGYLSVRVPNLNFDKVFGEIKEVATQVASESTNAQDVTEQYVDLEARLKNKKAEEESFANLLSRWGKVEEVLSVTRELARVRGEIEQLEGQKRYLDAQTDMSTITVYLSEDAEIKPVAADWRPWQVVKNSVREFLDNSQDFINGLIRFVVVVLPMLLIYVLIIWILYFIGRRIYRHYQK